MKYLDSVSLTQRLDSRLSQWQSESRLGGIGVCIMQGGQTLYKKYSGQVSFEPGVDHSAPNDHTLFRLASMTKPITAVATLIQVNRGCLDLDEPIERFLPAFSEMQLGRFDETGRIVSCGAARHKLTPRLLLNHTNGVGTMEFGEKQFAMMSPEDRQDIAHVVECIGRSLLTYEPSENQSYSSIWAFDVLARLIELTSDMDFAAFLRANIFEPCGMTDTTFAPTEEQWSRMVTMHDRIEENGMAGNGEYPMPKRNVFFKVFPFPTTWFSGGAGLAGTLPDYVRFAEMLRRRGVAEGGVRILPEELVREMGTTTIPEHIMPYGERWGLGVRVIMPIHPWMPPDCFGWSGAYGTHFWVDPTNDLTFVLMRNSVHDGGSGSQISAALEREVYADLHMEA